MNWHAKEFWIDGGCLMNGRKNPKAYGSISDGVDIMRFEYSYLKTNNEAEYRTLWHCLIRIFVFDNVNATIYSDSRLMIEQLRGKWKVKAKNLKTIHNMCSEQIKNIDAKLIWVPRKVIVAKVGH
jgi:ribonuclease HI